MKIFVRNLCGRTSTFNVDLSDTVKDLKDKIAARLEMSFDDIMLAFATKQTHDDSLTLGQLGVIENSTLFIKLPLRGGASVDPFVFNSLQKEKLKDFSSSAPDYRTMKKGLNLEGTCQIQTCKAFKKRVWAPKGMNLFNIAKEMQTSKCPLCKGFLKDVENCGFTDCLYSIEGMTD